MKTTSTTILIITTVLTVLGFCTNTTYAWRTMGRWESNRIRMSASGVSFPVGSPLQEALDEASDNFYVNPSNAYISIWYGDSSVGLNNGASEIWISPNDDFSPAVCFRRTNWWGDIIEADVIFFDGVNWTDSTRKYDVWSYGGNMRPLATTAMHEFGHAAGLEHISGEYNIMGQDWTHTHCNGTITDSYVGEDASAGLEYLYGTVNSSGYEDVAATLFRWAGRNGEYSVHETCGIRGTGRFALQRDVYDRQSRYWVHPGDPYYVEFTYENLGRSDFGSVRLSFYISTNSTISEYDRPIATVFHDLRANGAVMTEEFLMRIPDDLPTGRTYYLGVIVDGDNRIAEHNESNNAAYHVIRTH